MKAIPVSVLVILTACSQGEHQYDSGFSPQSYEKTADFDFQSYTHDQYVEVSAWRMSDGEYKYLPADCAISGNGFYSQFEAPKKVSFPVFGTAYQSMDVVCSHNGVSEIRKFSTHNMTVGQIRIQTSTADAGPCKLGKFIFGVCYTEKERKGKMPSKSLNHCLHFPQMNMFSNFFRGE